MSQKQSSTSYSGGIGFTGLLTIMFVCLKLTGHIDWSWWWVLSPMWIPLALIVSVVVLGFFIWGVFQAISYLSSRA